MCRGRDTVCADPDKQFLLLIDHIRRLREHVEWKDSAILVFVESNLGYESEHHERALRGTGRPDACARRAGTRKECLCSPFP